MHRTPRVNPPSRPSLLLVRPRLNDSIQVLHRQKEGVRDLIMIFENTWILENLHFDDLMELNFPHGNGTPTVISGAMGIRNSRGSLASVESPAR